MLPIARLAIRQSDTTRQKGAVWRHLRPVLEAVRHTRWVVLERLFSTQVMHTRCAIAQDNPGHAKRQGTVFC